MVSCPTNGGATMYRKDVTMTIPDLMTAEEVAEKLQYSRVQIYRMVKAGKLPYIQFSNASIRFDPAEINEYIDSNRTPVADST